jgi:hypothetical protein
MPLGYILFIWYTEVLLIELRILCLQLLLELGSIFLFGQMGLLLDFVNNAQDCRTHAPIHRLLVSLACPDAPPWKGILTLYGSGLGHFLFR